VRDVLVQTAVSNVELARAQFAGTSIYHFLFAPVTIGLSFLVAILHTMHYRRGDEDYLRLTRFFGTLLVINVAVGVVTGLVQEFQFGMNWSSYSRFVGDVFGAPLAIEGLAAFFLEATFLGVWIFGWGRLSRRVHLATIWLVALGALLSAAFIIAANSWMQHPVGYQMNDETGRAELTSIWAVLGNPVFLMGLAHVVLASLVTGSMLMLAVSAWHVRRQSDRQTFRRTARLALLVLVPSSFLAIIVGSELGVVITSEQPMKIAASEALWDTSQPASFSIVQIGGFSEDDQSPSFSIDVPYLLSFLATNSFDGKVEGLNDIQAQYEQQYGPGDYIPNVAAIYWSMRVMAYLASLAFFLSLWGAWLLWRGKLADAKWFHRIAIWAVFTPFVMNTAGWVLTEMGRQPWIVQGLQLTEDGVSPSVSTATVATSLAIFVLVYGVLAVVDAVLMVRFSRRPAPPTGEPDGAGGSASAMTY
jgi:cytochrome d ubiquinol oxidase subunit I